MPDKMRHILLWGPAAGFVGIAAMAGSMAWLVVISFPAAAIRVLGPGLVVASIAGARWWQRRGPPGSTPVRWSPVILWVLSGAFLQVAGVTLLAGAWIRGSRDICEMMLLCSLIEAVAGVVLVLIGPALAQGPPPAASEPG